MNVKVKWILEYWIKLQFTIKQKWNIKKKKKKIDLGFQPKNISIESAKILAFSISKIYFFLF